MTIGLMDYYEINKMKKMK